ncbi:MFS transporter [Candidatus Thorarchaeota archaeon]|nr:MAG: MFS transporter [Candidatus Thorarchaeota archaeon]
MEDENQVKLSENTAKVTRLSILSSLSRVTRSFIHVALPLFVLAIGQTESFYGVMVAAAGYVQAFVLFPAGIFSDRKGRGLSVLVGSIFSGICYLLIPFTTDNLLILVLYALTGVGSGFASTSISALVADYTEKGEERTKSYGITITAATLTAMIGSFLAGFILDPSALPGINPEMVRYAIVFFIMGGTGIVTGVYGYYTDRWLHSNHEKVGWRTEEESYESGHTAEHDTRTAILFGATQTIMGFSSGMVIPYLLPWINAAFTPDPVVLGSIPAISSITLATGTLFVGLQSERVGKLRMIFILYLFAPILMFGLVYAPFFLLMVAFYITRMAAANMARPATNSLFMGEVSGARRGRSWAIIRIAWTFSRQTGTLLTSFMLGAGLVGGMVTYGQVLFPIAMLLYPVSVIPMYVAVRRNSRRQQESEAASQLHAVGE